GEELGGERGHRQVEPLDAQARDAEDQARQHRGEPADDHRHHQRRAGQPNDDVVGDVGAGRHEGGRAERDLAAVAHQQVEAERGERQDDEGDQQREVDVVGREQRNQHEGHHEQAEHGPPVLQDREDLLVRPVAGLELSVFAIEHGLSWSVASVRRAGLHAIDDPLAEKALRADQQEQERERVGEPVLQSAADDRAEIELGELLADADDEAADDRAGDRGETSEDHHRQRLERKRRQGELHPQLAAPDHAGDQRGEASHRPDDNPDPVERNADRLRRLVVVGHRPQGTAGGGLLEEHRQHGHQYHRHDGGEDVVAVDQDAALEHRLEDEQGILGDAQVDPVDVRAPYRLAEAIQEV